MEIRRTTLHPENEPDVDLMPETIVAQIRDISQYLDAKVSKIINHSSFDKVYITKFNNQGTDSAPIVHTPTLAPDNVGWSIAERDLNGYLRAYCPNTTNLDSIDEDILINVRLLKLLGLNTTKRHNITVSDSSNILKFSFTSHKQDSYDLTNIYGKQIPRDIIFNGLFENNGTKVPCSLMFSSTENNVIVYTPTLTVTLSYDNLTIQDNVVVI